MEVQNLTISMYYRGVWVKRASLIFMVFERDHPNPFNALFS